MTHFRDFNKWNGLKKGINDRPTFPRPKDRDIWWCSIGRNIGSEQSCKEGDFSRPVLVVRSFGPETFWGLPITSSDPDGKKHESPFYFDVNGTKYINKEGEEKELRGYVSLSQLRLFDNRRLIRKLFRLEIKKFIEIREQIKSLI